MKNATEGKNAKIRLRFRSWIFPAGIIIAYLILSVLWQDRTLMALKASGRIFFQALPPLVLAFGLMFLLNLFVSPAHISKYLGHGTGIKGILLSSISGIISMGPIFAWYPFLKTLKEKGASDFHLANFLANRAVKPVLLPLMISYFGWRFSLVFTVICLACALLTATAVGVLGRRP